MTFSMMIKDELSMTELNSIEKRIILLEYLYLNSKVSDGKLDIVIENAKVARLIFKCIKELFNMNASITIRTQKRFRTKQIYILKITTKILTITEEYSHILDTIDSDEEKEALIKGAFLAKGSITDPKKSGYHFELSFPQAAHARIISKILKEWNYKNRIIKRNSEYMIYIKASETISDLLKRFKTTNSLFYFEDIRIYRDHKNMVNRLNNCEIANQEKVIQTGLKQIEIINYIKDNDLLNLLDEKTKDVIKYRELYPDLSYDELANIITMECEYKISKSGINHHFIKMRKLVERNKTN